MVNLEILLEPRQRVKKQRPHFADKGLCSQSYSFSSSDVWMWDIPQLGASLRMVCSLTDGKAGHGK